MSAIAVGEWVALAWMRRPGQLRDREPLLAIIIAIVAVGLFFSSLAYPGITGLRETAIVMGVLRVVLVLTGAHLLWAEHRRRTRAASSGR
jgi:hypothetical protein